MKKLTTIFAIAALAFAFTSAPAAACGGAAGCSMSKTASTGNASTKKSCNMGAKGTAATTASADSKANCNMAGMDGMSKMASMSQMDCPLSNGTFSVASYTVEGMTCGGCETGLTSKFEATDGVVMVPNVSFADGTAKVIYDPTITNVETLSRVISDAGFKSNIIPAVAVSQNASSDSKSSCSASKGATATTTGSSAGCSMSKGSATTANASGMACPHSMNGATASNGSSAGCSMANSQLTSAERHAFCSKFCMKDKKSEKKGTDI